MLRISDFRLPDATLGYDLCNTQYAIRNTQYAILANCRLSTVLRPLHLSRTLYKSALFMQNKPNLLDAQMNISSLVTMHYENISDWTLGENKPNSNPIKPNCRKGKIDANCVLTKDYEEKCGYGL